MHNLSFKRLLEISRFPHVWLYTIGFLSWGAMLAIGRSAFEDPVFWILFCWFTFPANIFLSGINDAFDYETDRNNPRKHSLESTVSKNGLKQMLWISLIALSSVVIIFPFISVLVGALILAWATIIIVYNVPPIRLKQYPVLDVLFGGVGQIILIGIIGYTAMVGVLPSLGLISIGVCFTAAWHIFGASFDAPYDLMAGIKNTTARIGTVKSALVAVALYILSALYGLYIDWPLFSIFVLILPAQILLHVFKGDLETRSVSIFKEHLWTSFAFGLITGTFLFWN